MYALWWTDEGGFGPRLRWKGGAAVTQTAWTSDELDQTQTETSRFSAGTRASQEAGGAQNGGMVTLREWP